MPLVLEPAAVRALYDEAVDRRWVLPCFCSENLATTEAILAAAADHARETGIRDLPVTVAMTVNYDHRPQARLYTQTRRWQTGLGLFRRSLDVLLDPDGPFADLRVMVHLDHVQPGPDDELLSSDLSGYSSILYDASTRPFDENVRMTADFVEKRRHEIVVEGACDEIVDADGQERNDITSPDRAARFMARTGADLMVANLGTEHRASSTTLTYHGDMARNIRDRVGHRIVLHGTSSVPASQVARLWEDGVAKVNVWTILERDASPVLFDDMVRNAVRVAGVGKVRELSESGWLGPRALDTGSAGALTHFTTAYRQEAVYRSMKETVRGFLALWLPGISRNGP